MAEPLSGLTRSAFTVLELIAAGRTYEQILSAHPEITYLDIFDAARQALAMTRAFNIQHEPAAPVTSNNRRSRHARAYEKWTDAEGDTLWHLVLVGKTMSEIARSLQRNRSEIRSQIVELGIVDQLIPKEQNRLRRFMGNPSEELDGPP